MHLQNLVIVFLRLLAVNFLLQSFLNVLPVAYRLTAPTSDLPESAGATGAPLGMMFAALAAGSLIIWFLAGTIARLVTRGIPSEISLGSLNLVDCYSVAFMGVGLFYIVGYLSPFLIWSHYLLHAAATGGDKWKEGIDWYACSQSIIPVFVGVLLLAYGRTWAVKLARRHGTI